MYTTRTSMRKILQEILQYFALSGCLSFLYLILRPYVFKDLSFNFNFPMNSFEIIWVAQISVRCKRTAWLIKLYFVHSRYTFRYTYCVTTYLLLVRRVTGDMCIFHCNLQYFFLRLTYLQIRLPNGFHH